MNKNARKLLAALRSGMYEQNTSCLRDGNAYCCLGVACDLYIKSHKAAHWAKAGRRGNIYVINLCEDDEYGNEAILPEEVKEWLGFKEPNGAMKLDGKNASLSLLNDSGADFDHIADFIETEPQGLFEEEG